MFSFNIDKIEVYDVGKSQLESWIKSGAVDNPVYAAHPVVKGDYVIVQLTSTFGHMRTTPLVFTGYLSILEAVAKMPDQVELPNPDKPWTVGYATIQEIWHVVDDKDLWADWERRVFTVRPDVPICRACGDEIGPWLRVPTPGGFGAWTYLCESCFDRYNRINVLVGRHRLECY